MPTYKSSVSGKVMHEQANRAEDWLTTFDWDNSATAFRVHCWEAAAVVLTKLCLQNIQVVALHIKFLLYALRKGVLVGVGRETVFSS